MGSGVASGTTDKKRARRRRLARPRDPGLLSVRQTGFTLLELLVAMMIAALILGIASPSFGEFLRSSRLTGVANDLLASVHLARIEAGKRQSSVSICAVESPPGEAPACSGRTSFGSWIVFEDRDGDCVRTGSEPVLRHVAAGRGAVDVAANGSCLSFGANGFLREVPGLASAFVVYEDGRSSAGTMVRRSTARAVEVLPTGRASITRDGAAIERISELCELPTY